MAGDIENVDLPAGMLEQVMAEPPEISADTFNPTVHESTRYGDPEREADGTIKLRKDWRDRAVDRQGRSFNPRIHGDQPELDTDGYIKVRRRDKVRMVSGTNRSAALVNRHREPGYSYRLVNDTHGRVEMFENADWEPVTTQDGKVSMPVGQAREASTNAILMRKPQEWYDEDQKRKWERSNAALEHETSPKEGQYVDENDHRMDLLR